MPSRFLNVFTFLFFAVFCSLGGFFQSAQARDTIPVPNIPAQVSAKADPMVWDALLKEVTPIQGAATADFIFSGTNITDSPVIIQRVQTSCGCTVAKLPSEPYTVVPHTNVDIKVTVNLADKFGTFFKTITVISTNAQKVLTIKVNLPQSPTMMRAINQQMASADHQAVFKGDCARCHVEPTKGLMGKELYDKACGICHEARPRATMVPDLHYIPHPTDYTYWRTIITDGKPNSLMPGFAIKNGGPLSDQQIDSLAKEMVVAFAQSPTVKGPVPPPQSLNTTVPVEH